MVWWVSLITDEASMINGDHENRTDRRGHENQTESMFVLTYQTAKILTETLPTTNVVTFVESRSASDLPGYVQISAPKNFPWYVNQLVDNNPFLVLLLGYIESGDAETIDRELRIKFAGAHHRGTWFRPSLEVLEFIRDHTKRPLLPVAPPVSPAPAIDGSLVSIEDVATYLKVSVPTVRRAISEGKIPFIKHGRLLRFHLPEVLNAVQSGVMPKRGG